MATHDYIISNASGASVRADLNNALAAIVSNNSNATSPATTYAYQWWADTTTGQLKLRNSSNSAWITIFELDGTMLMEDGTVSAPGLAFASDLNTGFFRSAADKINFATGGAERLEIGSSEVVFNDPSNDVDFRVESNGNSHMLFVDAGNDRVGIGTSAPGALLTIGSTSDSNTNTTIASSTSGTGGLYFFDGANSGALIYDHTDNFLQFRANGSERARIDSSGRLLVGTSADKSISSDANALVQIFTSSAGKLLIGRSDASVVADDFLGIIDFHTFDGGSQRGARIAAVADGDHASGDVPSRIEFSTCADGSSSLTERVRIDSSGNVGIATISPAHALDVHSASSGVIVAKQTTNNGGFNIYEGDDSSGNTKFYVSHNGRVGASDGIIFGSDTAAANVLDDYEEGTWTIGLSFGGSNTGMVFSRQDGVYVKIGNIVHVTGTMQITNKGSSTGQARLTGLPYTIGTGAAAFSPIADRSGINLGSDGQGAALYTQATTAPLIYGYDFDGTSNFQLNDTHFGTPSELDVNFSYIV